MEALHDVVGPGKSATSAPAACTPGSSRRHSVLPRPTSSRCRTPSLIYREEEREMIPQCVDVGVGVLRGVRSLEDCWRGAEPPPGSS